MMKSIKSLDEAVEAINYLLSKEYGGIKVKKTDPRAIVPKQATVGSAGQDLHVIIESEKKTDKDRSYIDLAPNECTTLHTGLAYQLPNNMVMLITPRSSMGIKKKLVLQNTLGVLDSDFSGECLLFVKNTGEETIRIEDGERLAQALFFYYPKAVFVEVDTLIETERGDGGWGSTGKF